MLATRKANIREQCFCLGPALLLSHHIFNIQAKKWKVTIDFLLLFEYLEPKNMKSHISTNACVVILYEKQQRGFYLVFLKITNELCYCFLECPAKVTLTLKAGIKCIIVFSYLGIVNVFLRSSI